MSKYKKRQESSIDKRRDDEGIVEIRIILRKKGGVAGFPEPGNRKETIVIEDATVGDVFGDINALLFHPDMEGMEDG